MTGHETARRWLDEQLSGRTGVGLPWPSLLAFVRITTNARIFEEPMSIEGAWAQVERWLDIPVTWIPEPTDRHREILASMVIEAGRPEIVPDAHLAALAMEHGLILHSTDRDFARFNGLRWKNPLE